jgi:hypothetical protein
MAYLEALHISELYGEIKVCTLYVQDQIPVYTLQAIDSFHSFFDLSIILIKASEASDRFFRVR